MPKQVPKIGDLFTVPLKNGLCAFGQVLETRPILMNSMTCAFFDEMLTAEEVGSTSLEREHVLSCQFVTRDAFNHGRWARAGNRTPLLRGEDLPYRETERTGWIGAKVIGSGIMSSFLNAYFGLGDWREMKDPLYYEGLLFGGRSGPAPV